MLIPPSPSLFSSQMIFPVLCSGKWWEMTPSSLRTNNSPPLLWDSSDIFQLSCSLPHLLAALHFLFSEHSHFLCATNKTKQKPCSKMCHPPGSPFLLVLRATRSQLFAELCRTYHSKILQSLSNIILKFFNSLPWQYQTWRWFNVGSQMLEAELFKA